MGDLGKLSPVDVRKVWADESRDFTPWLAENADKLSAALGRGLDMIHEQTEAVVGQYKADLVFRDEPTGRLVVVENMFGDTDHDHLGKLITYAAGLETSYAVLLSPEFRDEQRSALNWLNSISADDFGFFGVVLKVWRIGESPCAPQLVVEVKPDNWVRSVRAAGKPIERKYQRFWGEFLPAFRNQYPDWTQATLPPKRHWMSFPFSRPSLLNFNPAFCRPDRRKHRLPTGAWATPGPAPVDSPWKWLRAPARRRISAGAKKLGAASPDRAATVTKCGRPDHGGPNTEFLTLPVKADHHTISTRLR